MKFGATEATPDIYTYSPHSIREAIKIIGCPQILRHKDGCKQSTVWLYIFSYSQFFWITYSCHTLTPTTTATATTVIYIYIYIYIGSVLTSVFFTLKMVTDIHDEILEGFQQTMWLNIQNLRYTDADDL